MTMIDPKTQVLPHLEYALQQLDGACWACQLRLSLPAIAPMVVSFGATVVSNRTSNTALTNALGEVGIIYCRKVLNFLGIRLEKRGRTLAEGHPNPNPDDASVKQLGLQNVPLIDLFRAPAGTQSEIEGACVSILGAADKGVAHFTVDYGDRALATSLFICSRSTSWACEEYVYKALGQDPPSYKIWTCP